MVRYVRRVTRKRRSNVSLGNLSAWWCWWKIVRGGGGGGGGNMLLFVC